MTADPSVVAFLGPSLATAEAAALLPKARLEPPVRRGDLYRARNTGASVLLIIDGQFFHEEALPVREVIDVARDGATIFGASSMGALRAAECWPVGVRGVGLVYRLFRGGRLESDDEVAVATDPDDGYRATSVALVNVRVALRRAVRAGLLDPDQALAIVERARRLFYPERTWASIIGGACSADAALSVFCTGIDVKAHDARRLLRAVAALTADAGFIPFHRPVAIPPLLDRQRQRLADPIGSQNPEELATALARWAVGSGRRPTDRGPVAFTPLGVWTRVNADDPAFAKWLWEDLTATGELDAEIMRMRAVDSAVAEANARGLRVRALDRFLAEAEIQARHRCTSWSELRQLAETDGVPWSWIEEAASRLALARRWRAELFGHSPSAG